IINIVCKMNTNNSNPTDADGTYHYTLPLQTTKFAIFGLLSSGQLATQAISIAAELKIADYLKDGPKSIDDLSYKTKCHPSSLYRLLRALASIDIFAEIKDGDNRKFKLTPMASFLLSEGQDSIRNLALLIGLDSFERSINDLLYSVRTGGNAFKHANGLELFDYLQQNPNDARIFNKAMTSITSLNVSLISSMYDFSQFNTVIDIGGGQGLLLSTILQNNPHIHGILFDLPFAIESAKQYIQSKFDKNANGNNISPRCKLVAGDFFESIPNGADGYIFKNVILNWDDESVEKILKNCLHSMQTTRTIMNSNKDKQEMIKQKLLIIDMITPEGNESSIAKFLDILMLAVSHSGRIRTEKEFHRLLTKCGFEITNIIRSQDPKNFLNIIEAIPSSG
ncbi:MAG: methyltransferase, partial [Candidatus Nitrosopolaris sp.]